MSETKTPEVGEWWSDSDGDVIQVVFVNPDRFLVVYETEDDNDCVWFDREDLIRYLPNCTGFGYKPPAVKTITLSEWICANNSDLNHSVSVWKANTAPNGWDYVHNTGRTVDVEVPVE